MANKKIPGTILDRGNGSYQLQVSAGKTIGGKYNRPTKTVHCESYEDAENELILFYADVMQGRYDKPNTVTFKAFADIWLEKHVLTTLKHKTYDGYLSINKNHLIPAFGDFKLNKIKPVHVREWLNELQSSKLSQKTVNNIFGAFTSLIKTAIEWEYLDKDPSENIKPKPAKRKETDYYTYEETVDFLEKLNASKNLQHKAALMLALFTGLRLGELCGLKWENVHEDYITIPETRYYSSSFGVYTDTPKSDRSIRDIVVPKECMDLLNKLKTKQSLEKLKAGSSWNDNDYVFKAMLGKPIGYNTIPHWLSDFQDANGLRKVSLHKLRHTYVSMLGYLGTSSTEISRMVGHAHESTTKNIYTHLFKDNKKEIADNLSKEFLK